MYMSLSHNESFHQNNSKLYAFLTFKYRLAVITGQSSMQKIKKLVTTQIKSMSPTDFKYINIVRNIG